MSLSVFEIFKLGVGPSSSHTMGPMAAARAFAAEAAALPVSRLAVKLHGSLAFTGAGHGTDRAAILGLMGFDYSRFDPDAAEAALADWRSSGNLMLGGARAVPFDAARDIEWAGHERLPFHPNAIGFTAFDGDGSTLHRGLWFSIGGGFILSEAEAGQARTAQDGPQRPYSFRSAAELLSMAEADGITIAELVRRNELAAMDGSELDHRLDEIADAMQACIERGLTIGGELPGGLKVRRRAKQALEGLKARKASNRPDPMPAMDLVNIWAMAVNEENAAGGRVVTAPTNGAAGIVPAVLRFYLRCHEGDTEGARIFLLTAAAIGMLYKRNASISGAEVGCQGEVGVACSMAAGGLCAALGGSNAQIENAAEIGMEHNLGLTCDPIGGLVQIPCIERNAMGAIKAIDAARLALLGDGQHSVSLDKVIATMKRTGADMSESYKETSLGGLAVNLVEC